MSISNGILFYERNKVDLDLGGQITIAITDGTASDTGADYVDLMRNRRNDSGWATTGSNDAANTTLVFTAADPFDMDSVFFILHNMKSYTVKYWDGGSWADFSTPVNVSGNTDTTTRHIFTSVNTTSIQLIITGTMTANQDKFIAQTVLTQLLGQFSDGYVIGTPVHSQVRRSTQMLSGKMKITRNLGAFSCSVSRNNVINTTDLTLIETLYDKPRGFLVWLCGNSTTQFRTQRRGYRKQDLYLMDFKTEYSDPWDKGNYNNGTNINMQLVEII